jgi:hypothetical protein
MTMTITRWWETEDRMTETLSSESVNIEPERAEGVDDALLLIDRGLAQFSERSLVSAAEVADLLLDIRTSLTKRDVVSVN